MPPPLGKFDFLIAAKEKKKRSVIRARLQTAVDHGSWDVFESMKLSEALSCEAEV